MGEEHETCRRCGCPFPRVTVARSGAVGIRAVSCDMCGVTEFRDEPFPLPKPKRRWLKKLVDWAKRRYIGGS